MEGALVRDATYLRGGWVGAQVAQEGGPRR
jgi:hypothetical protein